MAAAGEHNEAGGEEMLGPVSARVVSMVRQSGGLGAALPWCKPLASSIREGTDPAVQQLLTAAQLRLSSVSTAELERRGAAMVRAVRVAMGTGGRMYGGEVPRGAVPVLARAEMVRIVYAPGWTPAEVMTPARLVVARMMVPDDPGAGASAGGG